MRAKTTILTRYFSQYSYHILVDEIEDHVCKTRVAQVAVDQQQLTEVFKPGDGKVTGHHSLGEDTQWQETYRVLHTQ